MRIVASLGWLASLGGRILYSLQTLQNSEPTIIVEVVPAKSWMRVLACQEVSRTNLHGQHVLFKE